MDYEQAVKYIESLAVQQESRPTLKRIETFLSCHNFPQHTFTAIHIGGTNGKGSTVAILDAMLREGKFKIGRFVGPHLLRFNERLHINGQPISDKEFAQRVASLKENSERFAVRYPDLGQLSWFEFITALAFFYFADHSVDIAVIEVGLGGRFDATNVLRKIIVTGITNIAFDHEHILGSDLETIAFEKAGIIKPAIPVVTAANEPALSVLKKRAAEVETELYTCDHNEVSPAILNSLSWIKNDINRRGVYQYQNALMALNILAKGNLLDLDTINGTSKKTEKITIESALQGLKSFYWPGRFQLIEAQQLILDSAHNPAGIIALRNSLDYLFPNQHFHFIFSCYADKDGKAMLTHLLKPGDRLYMVEAPGKRSSFSVSSIAQYIKEIPVIADKYSRVTEALAAAKAVRQPDEFIVATGSFSVIRSMAQILGWSTVEDGLV